MCDTCGCSQPDNKVVIQIPGEDEISHNSPSNKKSISVEEDILAKNNHLAQHNRKHFESKNITAYNLMSSPGAGKTTLLEKMITDLKEDVSFYVIEGDQQTMNDAMRIKATGVPVIQINTGSGCHLDADMIHKAIHKLNPLKNSLLMIENVGNLVCPAMFDLGESVKVVIISVTEGEDKPIKYPNMFHEADVCLINKIDLLPYVDFSVDQCIDYAKRVNHHLHFFQVSAKTGEGLTGWYDWIREKSFQVK